MNWKTLNWLFWDFGPAPVVTYTTGKYRLGMYQCVKSVQIQSFLWTVLFLFRNRYRNLLHKSPYSNQIWENRNQKKLHMLKFLTQWFLVFRWITLVFADILTFMKKSTLKHFCKYDYHWRPSFWRQNDKPI